ncbi:tRNA pseudouridine(38-40) synthase TruA [Aureisphaera galaxeae]|uniref:tRNA pseudouridine(38-40) synthase TruA n=1 Tax=Aureisphaera galaxeae TaxID=1538023 RepID=UPI002350F87C|nr:tRNA pseudouridine(38-40) synthase TruA [Aureisphaera galaxeae]MDC8004371.1 tRNA pseudouridine(38-40) synthase TruA [Aureisphaera galaxeae]
MFRKRYYYLLTIQFLGFRYHGWQKQPDVLTLERMVSRTLQYVLGHNNFKLLAAGRTDAKVSAHMQYVELFLDNEPLQIEEFFPLFNRNLPQDIRALEIQEVDESFNIIEAPTEKEYIYLFAYGAKTHPFAAPLMYTVFEDLDLDTMKQAAQLFEGTHDFKNYSYKPTPETKTIVTITQSEIVENELYQANFFPEKSYLYRIRGKGFKRHQIRLMMGALFDVGEGKFTLSDIEKSLQEDVTMKLERIVPASGLLLQEVKL